MCFHENDETYRFCQNCRCEAPRGLPPVRNGFNLLQVNEIQLRTRYDQFRSFQKETVGQRRESAVADGVVPFERNVGGGRCLPKMVVEWLCFLHSQGNVTTIVQTCHFVLPGGTVFPPLLRPLTRLYAALCVWITAEVIRIQA